MKLLLPVAGKSSRYPGSRPKWLLTMPNGQLMIERSLSGLNLENIKEIVVIMLEDHFKYITINTLKENLRKIAGEIEIEIKVLEKSTASQPSTIANYLKGKDDDFSFFIKDCDNFFKYNPIPENNVAFINLQDLEIVAASSKSFIVTNNFDEIEMIAEKKVISDKFCCGGYSFKSSHEFLKYYEKIGGDRNVDLYISHIIQKQLLDGKTFHSYKASDYEDYGTVTEFYSYISNTRSIFCDFDGVLVENSSKFANPPWQYNPIEENLKYISNFLKDSTYSKLIITTSRPSKEKINIEKFLDKYKIKCHSIITDLPHAKRVLINDFSKSNPYPTAQGINLPRDSGNLSDYF